VDVDRASRDRRAQPLADDRRVGRVGQQQQELLAAPAGRQVLLAQPLEQPRGDLAQDRVARGVAVDVVDALEAVDVDEHGAELAPVTAAARDGGAQHVVCVAAVGQPGHDVGARELLQLRVAAGELLVERAQPQRRTDPGDELDGVDGLADVVVGAALQPLGEPPGVGVAP
jgi:hypothetical protein